MISTDYIINELDSIEATISLMQQRCQRLRRQLRPVSTGSSKKTEGLTDAQKAKFLAKRHKTRMKVSTRQSEK